MCVLEREREREEVRRGGISDRQTAGRIQSAILRERGLKYGGCIYSVY